MKSSQIITLFTEPPPPRTAPSSFVVSMMVHIAVFGPLLLALKHTPRISDRPVAHRYIVRLLDQHRTEMQALQYAGKDAEDHVLQSVERAAAAGSPSTATYIPPQVPRLLPASQTLIQPDAPPDLQLPQETPVPILAVWSRDSSIIKKIVPPAPQEPAVTDVRPSTTTPNYETTLADLNISMSPAALPMETPNIPSSTTTPIVIRGTVTTKMVPQTASITPEQPTPARVISISTLQTQGPIVIPMANQASRSDSTEALTTQQLEKAPRNGTENQASKQEGLGAERSSIEKDNAIAGRMAFAKSAPKMGSPQGAAIAPATDNGDVTRISLPKDGNFGVVVVGSSMAEQYPETVAIWRGRLVYTVYLQVGLGKSWILQYSIPSIGATTGTMSSARPEAPWPFEILSPHLAASDYNSDDILVHGFVNLAGRFEGLSVVFPPEFTQTKFLLGALQQWQFRTARQDGKPAATEVLLIIPAQVD